MALPMYDIASPQCRWKKGTAIEESFSSASDGYVWLQGQAVRVHTCIR